MSFVQAASTAMRGPARWLLLGSLALNLFFIGVAVALAVRPPPPPPHRDRDVLVRAERIAETLPPADADILRNQLKANRNAIEQSHAAYLSARDAIRATLRQEPFDAQAMRTAMANERAARETFSLTIQGTFATAAEKMSSAGRQALADWRPGRKPPKR